MSEEEKDYQSDSHEASITSGINKAIKTVSNAGVVVILVPGEITFAYDIPTFVYDSDNNLHPWMLEALTKHVVMIKASDEKIQKTIEICRQCHFELFTVLDFPEQKVSGSAYSMVSSLTRILQSELDMFGKVKTEVAPEAATVERAPEKTVTSDVAETPEGKFGAITRKFNGVNS